MSSMYQMNSTVTSWGEDSFSFIVNVPFWRAPSLYSELEEMYVYIGNKYQKDLIMTGQYAPNKLVQP